MDVSEKRFESDIESFFLSPAGGYTRNNETYNPKLGLYVDTLINFIKATQPKEWARFERQNAIEPVKKFCNAFNNACDLYGLLNVLRKGFKHQGIDFKVCYFKPESALNETHKVLYSKNIITCNRQWYYTDKNKNSVDMVLAINGIPVVALELKDQLKGQNVENAKKQWMYDRSNREICFQFNKRILVYFCVDLTEVYMTTRLAGKDTYFLPFNQGSAGAGKDGGKGNPKNPNGYMTSYLWEEVLVKDSMMDIMQKFISLQGKNLIFPRYHQLHAVRKILADVKKRGAGHNYLIQHSAGSGKSNSIAWTAYRLASLFNDENKPIFASVIVITDRTVLNSQLIDTITKIDHTIGTVEAIGEGKTSQDLKDAINNGSRIIITTLQKFPVIYEEVDKAEGRNFAVIVDEAHSSQTGNSALKLKIALADVTTALEELAEIEGKEVEELDAENKLVKEMISHGKHKNLSFFAFTATPKGTTLNIFGEEASDGSFHPFHIYSMRQAIEEGFILDVLQDYKTYDTCFKIAKSIKENPDVPSCKAAKIIRKFEQLHPHNVAEKTKIIVETFRDITSEKIAGKGKMMVVTSCRAAAVKYFKEIKRYAEENKYTNVKPLIAFSGTLTLDGEDYSESLLNIREDGSHINENQTKQEFHDNFNILVVAEKYQTGFDEPLLHTMIVDKKLRSVKAVQTLSRLNRTHAGKNDTYILDFANTAKDIEEAFQPFYQESWLTEEVNTDLIYKTQNELRGYALYDDNIIDAFVKEYTKPGPQDDKAMGRMTSILKPCADNYNNKTEDERYQVRRVLRKFVKWYGYITQVVRMFDMDLQKEYVFCSYLLKLLPPEPDIILDLNDKLSLEYYKLKETFAGSIGLKQETVPYEPAEDTGAAGKDPLEPLEEVIKRINEKYHGDFTEADKVILGALRAKLLADKKLGKNALTSDPKIFIESIFPKAFEAAANEGYMESQEAYASMFSDQAKYKAMMLALAELLYRDFKKNG